MRFSFRHAPLRPARLCRTTPLFAAAAVVLAALISSCVTLSPLTARPEQPFAVKTLSALVPHWQPLTSAGGLEYFAARIAKPRLELRALRIDLSRVNIAVSAGNTSEKVSTFVRSRGLLAGINALPFDPVSDREGEPRTNVGIVVQAGRLLSPPRPDYDALIFYTDGGAAIVPQAELPPLAAIQNAVGGFHRILEGGVPAQQISGGAARHPRSAAGLSADGKMLYLLVIDGRRPGSAGATLAETAFVLQALGAADALNLDGGGSSALALRYPDGAVRAVNIPIHGGIPGRERAVGACLGVSLPTP